MNVLILGGDGYLGWPTAMHFSSKNHNVTLIDNYIKRKWEMELNSSPLIPVKSLDNRINKWDELTGKKINFFSFDIAENYKLLISNHQS